MTQRGNGANWALRRKMNQDVSGNGKLFFKGVPKVNCGNREITKRKKVDTGGLQGKRIMCGRSILMTTLQEYKCVISIQYIGF